MPSLRDYCLRHDVEFAQHRALLHQSDDAREAAMADEYNDLLPEQQRMILETLDHGDHHGD